MDKLLDFENSIRDTEPFYPGAIGSQWLRVDWSGDKVDGSVYLNWQTGEFQDGSSSGRVDSRWVNNLDNPVDPTHPRKLCKPLHYPTTRTVDSYTGDVGLLYDDFRVAGRYALHNGEHSTILHHCGTRTTQLLTRSYDDFQIALTQRFVAWVDGRYLRVLLLASQRRLRWRLPERVAGREVLLDASDRYAYVSYGIEEDPTAHAYRYVIPKR